MLVTFEMVTENFNINYKVFGKKEGNILTFPDKCVANTLISVVINDEIIEIIRKGDITMNQSFKLNTKLPGFYKNELGMECNIASFTKKMEVTENSIMLVYDNYLENEWQSSNKLKIIF